MRKFENIRENILMIHNKNSKRVEKEEIDSPGPLSYNPSYKLIEESGFAVNNSYFYIIFIKVFNERKNRKRFFYKR